MYGPARVCEIEEQIGRNLVTPLYRRCCPPLPAHSVEPFSMVFSKATCDGFDTAYSRELETYVCMPTRHPLVTRAAETDALLHTHQDTGELSR